jgi:hypothetical protein
MFRIGTIVKAQVFAHRHLPIALEVWNANEQALGFRIFNNHLEKNSRDPKPVRVF